MGRRRGSTICLHHDARTFVRDHRLRVSTGVTHQGRSPDQLAGLLARTARDGVMHPSLAFLRFRTLSDHAVDVLGWRRRFVAGAFASGLVWGLAGVVLYSSGSLFHQVVLAFILAGVSAGALTAYSPIPRAYFFFVFPVVIPLAIRFLVEGGEARYSMAALTLLFLAVVVRSSIESSRLIANVFATQAKNLELTEELHHQATHDSLVNLVNHGEFKRRLASIASRAKLRREPYALLSVDLDNFKTVNDTGGHAAG